MPPHLPVNLLDDPKFKSFMDGFLQLFKATKKLSMKEGRKLSTEFFLPSTTIYEPVFRIESIEIERNDQKIPLRLYVPSHSHPLPVLLYFHRGGWVFGNIEEADPICRKLANHLGCLVISVDYRLAPENPFPAPLNDCYEATLWAAENAGLFGGNAAHLIVCGESAGGNLAAAVTLMARDLQKPSIAGQLLIYPIISSSLNETAYKHSPDQYFLTKAAMRFFWSQYLQSSADHANPYASPNLASDFHDLPSALILTAEYDPLHEEAEAYAKTLQQREIPTLAVRFPKVIHGFLDLPIYEERDKLKWLGEIRVLMKELGML